VEIKVKKAPEGPPPSEMDSRLQLLLTLITLLKGARHKTKKSELEFMIVNQTFNLVRYRHCVFWEWNGESVSIATVSGLVQVDPDGPYGQWIKRVLAQQLQKKGFNTNQSPGRGDAPPQEEIGFTSVFPVGPKDCAAEDWEEWSRWASAHALMFVMKDRHGQTIGGLWLDRDEPFNDLEMTVLEDLGDGYAHALHRFGDADALRKKSFFKSFFSLSRSNTRRIALILLVIMMIPVRMSASAPAEIVARQPFMVSVPFDGIIGTVNVTPGQAVKKGDILVHMDSTVLKNKMEISTSEMETAEIALSKTERESLGDRQKLADIAVLKAQLAQRDAEKKYAEDMLARAEIRADRDGIVIFSDPNALRGKPVQTGEQIMLIADPQDTEVLIRIPVESMIEIDKSVPAKFYLNVMPMGFRKADYESIGYQATMDPDGLMTYKIRATFTGNGEKPRIGLTGTGKVYGDRTVLGFNILRRPLITLRRKFGI
jgi:hypothetical protein